jgi:4-hydroxyphenylpyruvate dioxygenase
MECTTTTTHLQNDGLGRLIDIDHIELYVGNTHQAAHFYRNVFDLTPTAYSGLETGRRDGSSLVVERDKISLMLTGALGPEGPIAEHVRKHGDAVKDIAFSVTDAPRVFDQAVKRGARPVMEPEELGDEDGQVIKATVGGFGNIEHSLIQRKGRNGTFLPHYKAIGNLKPAVSTGISSIDHIAFGVESGKLNEWVQFYTEVFGFSVSHQEDVTTEYSAMNSKVVQSGNGQIKFPIVEPAIGKRKSQVSEYLEFHCGAGVQHVALLTDNIVRTVLSLRANNVEFLAVPESYYDMLESRIGAIDEDVAMLRSLNILVDRDQSGYLLQIFTKPMQTRPTFFYEIIQRHGGRGFGGGNIKALFEAVELEQARRGNL